MALESYYINGGFIGKAFDLTSTEFYTTPALIQGQLTYEWFNHTSSTHPTATAGLDAFFDPNSPGITLGGTGTYTDSTINWGDQSQTGILGTVGAKPGYLPAGQYSWRVYGFIVPTETGTYTFSIDGDDACDIIVNGVVVCNWYNGHGFSSQTARPSSAIGTIVLIAGQPYSFEARFEEVSGGDGIVVAWQPPSGSSIVAVPISVLYTGSVVNSNKKNSGIWSLPAVLDSITVSPYRVTPSVTTVDEDGSVTFDIVAIGLADGTTLYWTTASFTDFVTNNGSFTITNEQGSFNVSPISDITTEGPESFEVNIRTGNAVGPIVATSETVFINDTSTTPRSLNTSLVDNSSVNTSAWTQQSVFNITPTINETGYTVTSSAITIPEEGTYLCSFNCYFNSIVERTNIGVSFGINGMRENEISGSNYIRGLVGHNEATTSLTTIFQLSPGDEINLFFTGLGEVGTVDLIGSLSYISINKIA